ncbi:MAG: radical SAM protein [Elusimicrobia bacterium]|nr:radical SAM protein [Candidatus Liberimonas magnetica]
MKNKEIIKNKEKRKAPGFSMKNAIEKGYSLIKSGEYAAGVGCIEKIAADDPGVMLDYFLIGYGYKMTGRYDAALKYFKRAKLQDKKDIEIDKNIGEMYFRQKKYKQAIKVFSRLIKKAPLDSGPYKIMGDAYKDLGDEDKALECYLRAKGKGAKDIETDKIIIRIYYKRKMYKELILMLMDCLADKTTDESAADEFKLMLSRADSEYGMEFYGHGNKEYPLSLLKGHLKLLDEKKDVFAYNKILNTIELLERRTVLRSKPLQASLHLTTKCNLKCIMCDFYQYDFDITEKTAEEIMELFPYLESIEWLGGEVFFSKHFERLFNSSLSYKNITSQIIFTNGLLLSEPFIEKCVKHGVNIFFSIDSVNKKNYEKIRRGARFEDLIHNLNLMALYRKKYGYKNTLLLNVVIMNCNYKEMPELLDFAKKHGFSIVEFSEKVERHEQKNAGNIRYNPAAIKYLHKVLPGIIKRAEELKISINLGHFYPDIDITKQVKKIEKINDKYPKIDMNYLNDKNSNISYTDYTYRTRLSYCHSPWNSFQLMIDGSIRPDCTCKVSCGDFNKQPILKIWNGPVMQEYRKTLIERSGPGICPRGCFEKRNVNKDGC